MFNDVKIISKYKFKEYLHKCECGKKTTFYTDFKLKGKCSDCGRTVELKDDTGNNTG